ncbi:hypothetical protein LAZ67_6001229 [Cordylochernes scorpioides]|uniref:ISXO2-like transposase domain-containing protein n=1 Tax=Cordylochernes scorpioides TaxID=51811 RepID=A0ABY6KJ26_9ARAC|nr:hypothetical protein LAZ67_6001229 [Cordylochernes scorpioides]
MKEPHGFRDENFNIVKEDLFKPNEGIYLHNLFECLNYLVLSATPEEVDSLGNEILCIFPDIIKLDNEDIISYSLRLYANIVECGKAAGKTCAPILTFLNSESTLLARVDETALKRIIYSFRSSGGEFLQITFSISNILLKMNKPDTALYLSKILIQDSQASTINNIIQQIFINIHQAKGSFFVLEIDNLKSYIEFYMFCAIKIGIYNVAQLMLNITGDGELNVIAETILSHFKNHNLHGYFICHVDLLFDPEYSPKFYGTNWSSMVVELIDYMAEVVADRRARTLIAVIKKYVLPGTTIISDGFRSYYKLDQEGFDHLVVNHKLHFKDPETGAHTNNIEATWGAAKKLHVGKRKVKDSLEFYLSEYWWRRKHYIDIKTIAEQSGVSDDAVTHWVNFCREVCYLLYLDDPPKIGGKGKQVQIDVSLFGHNKKTKNHCAKTAEGHWIDIKTIAEQSGVSDDAVTHWVNFCREVCYLLYLDDPPKIGGKGKQVVADRRARTLIAVIKKYVLPGTTIISDGFRSYYKLDQEGFDHLVVNHKLHFKDPETGAHTNNIEATWGAAKKLHVGKRKTCPHCGRDMELKSYTNTDHVVWRCRSTSKKIGVHSIRTSVRCGTWFEKSTLKLHQIITMTALWVVKIDIKTIAEQSGVSDDAVTHWVNFCREVCYLLYLDDPPKIGGKGKQVQIDESLFGHNKKTKNHSVPKLPKDIGDMELKSYTNTDHVVWRCRSTSKKIGVHSIRTSLRCGTWFEKSTLKLHQIITMTALWVVKIDIKTIAEQSGVSDDAVTHWVNFCREVCYLLYLDDPPKIGGKGKQVQIDVSLFGHNKKTKNHCAKTAEGHWIDIKTIAEQSGVSDDAVTHWVNFCREVCYLLYLDDPPKIGGKGKQVLPGTTIISDGFRSYYKLDQEGFDHLVVNHKLHFKDPETGAHTNNIEATWGAAKKLHVGKRKVKDSLEFYLSEYWWRRSIMWRTCPHCGRDMELKSYTNTDHVVWRCRSTSKKIGVHSIRTSLRCGTWFEKSTLKLHQIITMTALWVVKIDIKTIAEQSGVSDDAVTHWVNFCREVCYLLYLDDPPKIGGKGKQVQIDESLFGHNKKTKNHCAKTAEGHWVFGGVDVETKVFFFQVVADRRARTLIAVIKKYVLPGTTIISDGFRSYYKLDQEGFDHLVVNHKLHFKDPETGAHTNNIEATWGAAKKLHVGKRKVKDSLEFYLSEYWWRRKHYIDIKTIAEQSGVSDDAVTHWVNFCREVCYLLYLDDPPKIGGKGKQVQIDESLFGHNKKTKNHCAKTAEGHWVFGGVDVETKVFFFQVVADRRARTLIAVIKKYVLPGTTIISDGFRSYYKLDQEGFDHLVVNHKLHFKDPETGAHTNNIEATWGAAKKLHVGKRKVKDSLEFYLSEYWWRRKHYIDIKTIAEQSGVSDDAVTHWVNFCREVCYLLYLDDPPKIGSKGKQVQIDESLFGHNKKTKNHCAKTAEGHWCKALLLHPVLIAELNQLTRKFHAEVNFGRLAIDVGLRFICQIAADIHLGASTLHRLWRRWLVKGNEIIYRNACAARGTSARMNRRILRQAVADLHVTCTSILQNVQDTLAHSISTRTIFRRLVAFISSGKKTAIDPTEKTPTVVLSDESRFCLSSDSSHVRVRRRRGEKSNPADFVERPTARQGGIMVWDAIAYDIRSPLGVPNALYQKDNTHCILLALANKLCKMYICLLGHLLSRPLTNRARLGHYWTPFARLTSDAFRRLWQMVKREWRAIPQDAIVV